MNISRVRHIVVQYDVFTKNGRCVVKRDMAFSYKYLSKIAGTGAVGVIGLGLYGLYRMATIHNNSTYFHEAFSAVQSHAGVKKFLGSPLSTGYVQVVPSEVPSPTAQFVTNIKGPIASGAMYFWAERKLNGDSVVIDVNRIEVEIAGDKTKRLVVKG